MMWPYIEETGVEQEQIQVPDDRDFFYTTTEYDWLLATLNFTLQEPDMNQNITELERPNVVEMGSPEYDQFWEFWVPGVMLNFVGVLGLIGNTISITILSRPQMKSSINCLLIGLASFDIILILTSILMFGLPSIYTHTMVTGDDPVLVGYFEHIFPYITPFVFPVGLMAQTGSVYLTVCVAVERYVAVCHPLRAKSLCTFGRAKLYVVTTALFSIGYNLPRCWEVSWKETYSQALERNVTEVVSTPLRQDPYYIGIYINWMYLIFLYLIPFTLLAVFNILIFREVRRANKIRAQLSRNQKREIGLAIMLFCVVIVFFFCNFLALVVNILEHFGKMFHPLTQTNNLLITVNSSVNFVIYCIFGEKFKRIFFKLLCSALGRSTVPVQSELFRYPNHSHNSQQECPAVGGTPRTRLTPPYKVSSAKASSSSCSCEPEVPEKDTHKLLLEVGRGLYHSPGLVNLDELERGLVASTGV